MSRQISFTDEALKDFYDFGLRNRNIFKRIMKLIEDIKRDPFDGLGKPEALKYQLSGYWSRRISIEHRLVYEVTEDDILIISCKGHYAS